MAKSPNEDSKAGRLARRTLAVLLGLACGLAVAELGFSTRDHGAFPHLNVYRADSVYGARLRAGAATRVAFGGAPVSSVFIHGGGFRGKDTGPEPKTRSGEVLFVGDSQTFGLGVEESEAFPARFGELTHAPVYNAGVPTWGPPEFAHAIDELGQRRHPATVVYVVNFANDPFEAERPNLLRHAVWDGWAVRRETAPAHVTEFPGRELLFQRSHLVLALRRWWHGQSAPSAQDAERGLPSEGTFRDLFQLGRALEAEQQAARAETERRAALYETEATYAQEAYRLAESRVRALVWKALKLGSDGGGYNPNSPGAVYLAADANPGDIVSPGVGEEGRPVYATAVYIRQAVALRQRFEAELTERARAALGSDEGQQILAALSERDRQRLALATVRAKPLELLRTSSPLTRAVLEAKRRVDALGARFVLLVLPLDVMVSDAEWPKHGKGRVDLSTARVLISDLVDAVHDAGGVALDASDALAAAEPGAFLAGDIHLTPKGHAAVAGALAAALSAPPPASPGAQLALSPGRSRVPPPETWTLLGGEVAVNGSAGCPVTKKYREWLYIRCVPQSSAAPRAVGLEVVKGGLGDALSWVSDGEMTLVAPIPPGAELEAVFSWSDGKSKRLRVVWDAAGTAPDLSMAPDPGPAARQPGDARAAVKLCACHQAAHPGASCGALIANADASCLETYEAECPKLLACAEGDPLFPPRCAPGFHNAGATLHCAPGAPSTSAPAASSGPPVARPSAPSPELSAAARGLMQSAEAFVGNDCRLGAEEIELISIIPYDRCPTSQSLVERYERAWAAFDGLSSKTPLLGEGATFRDKARAFGTFTRSALASGDTRGTAAFLQGLALSFNAWLPELKVPVDPPRLVALYFGLSGVPSTDYFRNLRHDGAKRRAEFEASGKHFIWRRGPNGFEGPYLEGDGRVVGGYPN
jgi:hypothetical protein